MRDQIWLENKMEFLWKNNFSEVKRKNIIKIEFGRNCRTRLGSIRMKNDQLSSKISINGLFKDFFIPEEVVLATIAHELTHYIHGFNSPLPQKFKHPHRGGCVDRELMERGFGKLLLFSKKWLKANWSDYVNEKVPPRRRKRRRWFR